MTLSEQPIHKATVHERSLPASDCSRRSFLQTGVAVGEGLILSSRLPFAKGDAEAATPDKGPPNKET